LESKIDSKLYKLSEVVKGKSDKVNHAKVEIEQMVSDITHQVKTPISNIRMYSDTIINNDLSKEQEKEFLNVISNQVDKLEFLMDSLTKMSKLETNRIVLNKESSKFMECIEKAKENRKDRDELENKRKLKNTNYNILASLNKEELERYRKDKVEKNKPEEDEFLNKWIDVFDYE